MKKIFFLSFIILFSATLPAKKVGLALSGGGAKCLAHIGLLKVIDEENIQIDYIAGTSTGAFIAALYAMGYSALEIEQMVLNVNWEKIFDETISRSELYIAEKRWMPYANISFELDEKNRINLPKAFISGNNFINFLFDVTYDAANKTDFDELPIPFRCVSTNILTGEEKVFAEGSLHEVILASMAYPSLIYPIEIDSELYIDGGISSNLPAEIVKNMGANIIIGSKTTSDLKNETELRSMLSVLEQTVNLNIKENMANSLKLCDVLFQPDVSEFSLMDFQQTTEIIKKGETSARSYFESEKLDLPKRTKRLFRSEFPEKIKIDEIIIEGNIYLSTAKIKEYLNLKPGNFYTKDEIISTIRKVYHSNLFTMIYPVIEQNQNITRLVIKVTEEVRKKLAFGLVHNSESEFSIGTTLKLRNLLQANSLLKLNIQLGDNFNLNLDYVKNFGKHYGVYFRLFPYLNEENIYSYNDDHEKTKSVRSFEYGGTFGVGFFASEAVIVEGYGYGYQKNLYKDIAEFEDTDYHSAGIGLKLYHESLDDFYFPMRGGQILIKYSSAKRGVLSEEGNKKFFSKIKLLIPVQKDISLKYKFEYGSYFKKVNATYDPFYIGGLDSYLGLNSREFSAPIYKINTIALRINPTNRVFLDLHYNVLNLGNVDIWTPEQEFFQGYGIKVGYKTLFGPIRLGAALDEDNKEYFYFSLGYESDSFIFSRR